MSSWRSFEIKIKFENHRYKDVSVLFFGHVLPKTPSRQAAKRKQATDKRVCYATHEKS